MTDCLFCKIVARQIPGDIVHETDDVLAFRDVNPQAPDHILVIPKVHVATVDALEADQAETVGRLFLAARRIAADLGFTGAYRLVMNCGAPAGQSVFHIHLHVLAGRSFAWPPG